MLVSIITPSFNQGLYIEETIISVINQSYTDIEYIIVDGGSTDNTIDILETYRPHPRVADIIIEKDSGQTDAINKGFKKASGDILGWINSDDLLPVDVVEKSVRLFEQDSGIGLSYGDIQVIDEGGREMYIQPAPPHMSKDYLLNINYNVCQPGSFYSRSAIEKVKFLDENLHFCMDMDLWINILSSFQAKYIESVAGCIRRHEHAKSRQHILAFIKEIVYTLKKHGARRCSPCLRKLYLLYLKIYLKQKAAFFLPDKKTG